MVSSCSNKPYKITLIGPTAFFRHFEHAMYITFSLTSTLNQTPIMTFNTKASLFAYQTNHKGVFVRGWPWVAQFHSTYDYVVN